MDAQAAGMDSCSTCTILKPMHNVFAHLEGNKEYKHTLDEYLKKHGQDHRKLQRGTVVGFNHDSEKMMSVKDMTWAAIHDTIPKYVLDKFD